MRVLVFGAGQLAQMMYLAAVPLGIVVQAVDVSTENVVHPVSKQTLAISLQQAMQDADAITVEFEHVPEHLLAQASETQKLYPNIESILAGADRVREKALLERLDIPNCQHEIITDVAQLDGIEKRLGDRIIFKASRDGYDGYGQWRLSDNNSIDELAAQFASLDLQKVPLIAEKMMMFDREISIIGARSDEGNIRCFAVAENLHHEGQLHVSVAPATPLDDDLQKQAQQIFTTLADGMDYIGVLAVELFQCGDTLLVNEIAPRVHNSGHWTQQGCATSQFEQHIRAVLNIPLGATDLLGHSAMINIIGFDEIAEDIHTIPRVHLHWYAKSVRAKRKMGHINVVAESTRALGQKLAQLAELLPEEKLPHLQKEAKRLQNL